MLDAESMINSEIKLKDNLSTYDHETKASRLAATRLHSLLRHVRGEKKLRWRHLSLAMRMILALAAASTLSANPFLLCLPIAYII